MGTLTRSLYSVYTMLMHSHLEYAAPIWDLHLIKHLLNCPKFCNKNVFKAVGHGLPGPTSTISPPYSPEPCIVYI